MSAQRKCGTDFLGTLTLRAAPGRASADPSTVAPGVRGQRPSSAAAGGAAAGRCIVLDSDVLGLGAPAGVQVLADVGLGLVLLLAGHEVDLRLFREDAGRRALIAGVASLGLAAGVVGALAAAGLVEAFLPVALGLTTTALGTLLPVLREEGLLRGRLGRYLLAAAGVSRAGA